MSTQEKCRAELGGDIIVTKGMTRQQLKEEIEKREKKMWKLQADQKVTWFPEHLGPALLDIETKARDEYDKCNPPNDSDEDCMLSGKTERSTSTGGQSQQPDNSSTA
jgi:hypothetical protein